MAYCENVLRSFRPFQTVSEATFSIPFITEYKKSKSDFVCLFVDFAKLCS